MCGSGILCLTQLEELNICACVTGEKLSTYFSVSIYLNQRHRKEENPHQRSVSKVYHKKQLPASSIYYQEEQIFSPTQMNGIYCSVHILGAGNYTLHTSGWKYIRWCVLLWKIQSESNWTKLLSSTQFLCTIHHIYLDIYYCAGTTLQMIKSK